MSRIRATGVPASTTLPSCTLISVTTALSGAVTPSDRAAVMVVRALREVYGVLHPVYLDADGLEPESGLRPVPPRPHRAEPDPDEVVRPSSVEEVRAVIDLAVAGLYDEAPE